MTQKRIINMEEYNRLMRLANLSANLVLELSMHKDINVQVLAVEQDLITGDLRFEMARIANRLPLQHFGAGYGEDDIQG